MQYIERSEAIELSGEYNLVGFGAVSMENGVCAADPETRVFRFIHLPKRCDVYNVLDPEQANLKFAAPNLTD